MLKFLLLLLCPAILFAQKTKIVTKYLDNGKRKTIYSVLDYAAGAPSDLLEIEINSLPEVKHGKFEFYVNDTLIEEGYYKFGLKDSIWKQYDPGNGKLFTCGPYYYDLRDGVWQYYNQDSLPFKKYNYNTNEVTILDSTYFDKAEQRIFQKTEIPPRFIGGEDALMEFLGKNIKYPPDERDKNIQGRVYIAFVIDRSGNVIEAKVLRGIGPACDAEALRVVNLMNKNMWTPGYQNGRPVAVQYNLPIVFNLKNWK